jgi:hypothetical protein
VLLQQHGQQKSLKRERVGRVSGGSQVFSRRGEQFIQGALVTPTQGAPETGKGVLLLYEYLGDGG